MRAQPPGRRGTVGHPYSALNLRLVLATFGLITSGVFAALLLRAGFQVLGWAFTALAVFVEGEVVGAENHILRRNRDRLTVGGLEQVACREHEEARLGLSLG